MSKPPPDPEYTLRGCDGPITCLLPLVRPGSDDTSAPERLLCGTELGTVYVWDVSRRRVCHHFQAHSKSVLALHRVSQFIHQLSSVTQRSDSKKSLDDVTSDCVSMVNERKSDLLLSHGREGVLHMWVGRDSDWKILRSYTCSAPLTFCPSLVICLGADPCIVSVHAGQGDLAVTSMVTDDDLRILSPGQHGMKTGMCMTITSTTSDGDTHILAGYEDGSLALWDAKNSDLSATSQLHSSTIICIDYCSSLNQGVSGSVDEALKLWTLTTSPWTISILRSIELTNPGLNCVCFRSDGKLLATGGWDNKVRLFSGKSGKPLAVLSAHKDSVQSVTFSAYHTLLCGGKDGMISVWNIYR